MSGGGYLKFRNDHGVPEIRIGVKEFECIGVSPPLDHPHIYINMGEADTILCPYCATRFCFDPRLLRPMRIRRTVYMLRWTIAARNGEGGPLPLRGGGQGSRIRDQRLSIMQDPATSELHGR